LPFGGFFRTPIAGAWMAAPLDVTPFKSKDPLHGVTLEEVLTALVAHYGWEDMGRRVPIRCFLFNPSVASSLTFLRRTPWARARVEDLYLKLKLGL
jgi:uncharacterized protein (DUF2132 family)